MLQMQKKRSNQMITVKKTVMKLFNSFIYIIGIYQIYIFKY